MCQNCNHPITTLQKAILKWVFRKIVTQSPYHKRNIEVVYSLLYDAARAEFSHDPDPALKGFLRERFEVVMEQR